MIFRIGLWLLSWPFLLLQIFSLEQFFPHTFQEWHLALSHYNFARGGKVEAKVLAQNLVFIFENSANFKKPKNRGWISQTDLVSNLSAVLICGLYIDCRYIHWKMKLFFKFFKKLSKARMKTFHLNFLEKSMALFPRKWSWGCLLFCVHFMCRSNQCQHS